MSRFLPILLSASFLALIFHAAMAPAAEPPWLEIHSTHYTVITDAGNTLPGKISFISSKAEFTPRNVQTAEDRSKLVYRVKISVDNRQGVLKQGMPVEAEIPYE